MSYLDLVEEYPKNTKMTLFEKVIMTSKRAKDLHAGKTPLIPTDHTSAYQAIEEVKEGAIVLIYRDEEEQAAIDYEAEEKVEDE